MKFRETCIRYLPALFLISGHAYGEQAGLSSHLGEIPFIESNVVLDGKVQEAAWERSLRVDINIETEPAENKEATVKTYAYIHQDGENLLVAFKAFDSSPESIRAYLSDRDDIWRSDLVSIKLDTFNDSRRAFVFYSTPVGLQGDVVLDDNNDEADRSWDSIWESDGSITPDGYEVEMKIPFKALRFESKSGKKTWGIELFRVIRKEVVHRISSQAKIRGLDCGVCQLKTVTGFEQVKPTRNLMIIPSVVLSSNKNREISENSVWGDSDSESRVGMDLRWGISEQAYLNMTLNPDFSQVEADAFQLDVNTRSVLFLTEKRPFFLDGKDYFNNWSKLVYSRIFEEPEYGIKYTAKQDSHTLGFMALKDKHTNFVIPYSEGSFLQTSDTESDNFSARYRYDLEEQSNLGFTLTHRSGDDYSNSVAGFDGKYWFSKKDYFRFQTFWSDTNNPDELVDYYENVTDDGNAIVSKEMTGSTIAANYTHTGRDWRWYVTYHRFDEEFRADSGFIGVSNWKRDRYGLIRSWYSKDKASLWNSISITATHENVNRLDDDKLSRTSFLSFEVNGIYESEFGIDLIDKEEYLSNRPFSRDAIIFWGEFKPVPRLGVGFEVKTGDSILYSLEEKGDDRTYELDLDFQFSENLNTRIEYIRQNFDLDSGRYYNFDLVNFKTSYQINEISFLRLTLQNRSLDYTQPSIVDSESRGLQFLYSYKINPFTLFYLGYSDAASNSVEVRSPIVFDKTLFAKFSYAWQL